MLHKKSNTSTIAQNIFFLYTHTRCHIQSTKETLTLGACDTNSAIGGAFVPIISRNGGCRLTHGLELFSILE
jgi:hypothetical protein